jgi:hypothetical protein
LEHDPDRSQLNVQDLQLSLPEVAAESLQVTD